MGKDYTDPITKMVVTVNMTKDFVDAGATTTTATDKTGANDNGG